MGRRLLAVPRLRVRGAEQLCAVRGLLLLADSFRAPAPSELRTTVAREDSGAIVLEIEAPRFRKDNVTVKSLDDGRVLSVTGHHADGAVAFERSFAVSSQYDLSKVEAEVADGVIKVRVPQKAAPAPTPIPLQQEAAASSSSSSRGPAAADASPQQQQQQLVEKKAEEQRSVFVWPPKVEVAAAEQQGPLSFTVALPTGGDEPQVSVTLPDPRHLSVSVSHRVQRVDERGHVVSQQSGSFVRTFPLPCEAKSGDVAARIVEEGAGDAKSKKLVIEVKTGAEPSKH